MRFFTPDLYVRFNSSDEEEANEADGAWENAILEYRKHLDGIRDRLPSQVGKLADTCLHDAELLAYDRVVEPASLPPHEPMAILSIKREDGIVSLIYILWDRIRESPPQRDWPFSKLRTHWLYDEVDTVLSQREKFLHRILLSDGRVLEIPFRSVVIHNVSLATASEGEESRQSA